MSYGYRQYRDTAHRWTQIGVGLISVIAGLILIVCVTAPMYVSSMLKDAGLSAAISHRFMDTVFDSLGDNMEALSRIQTSIEDSKIVDRIAQKYTTAMVDGMLKEKSFDDIEINIDAELDELMDMTYNKIASNINMGNIQETIVRAALSYSKNAANEAINNYASGIYIFIANIIGNRCMAAVSNRYLGRTVFIDTQIAYRVMGVMCILAAASYVITLIYGMVVKNRRKRI